MEKRQLRVLSLNRKEKVSVAHFEIGFVKDFADLPKSISPYKIKESEADEGRIFPGLPVSIFLGAVLDADCYQQKRG